MAITILAFLIMSLIATFAVDLRQKRRKFILEENNHSLRS